MRKNICNGYIKYIPYKDKDISVQTMQIRINITFC